MMNTETEKSAPIQQNPSKKSLRVDKMEQAEINALYTMANAIYFLAQDAEKRLFKKKFEFRRESRQHFTRLTEALKRAKYEQDQLEQDSICNQLESYDNEQQNAYDLARLVLLWYDRIDGYHARVNAVEKFIRDNYPAEDVDDGDLKVFNFRKI